MDPAKPRTNIVRTPLLKAYHLALFLILAAAHSALMFTGELNPLHVFAGIGALVLAGIARARLARLPAYFWNALVLAALAGGLAVALAPPRDFETYYHGVCYFLLYVFTIRFFTRAIPRDDLLLFLLALLEICAASIANVSLTFLLSIAVFGLCMIVGLMLFSMLSELDKSRPRQDREAPPTARSPWTDRIGPGAAIDRRFYSFALAAAVGLFVLGFVIFFFIPRLNRGFFWWRGSIQDRVSGFSESVQLGSVGKIKMSDLLVMRVKIAAGPNTPLVLYFRGNALDYFDGHGWRDTLGEKKYHDYRRDQTVTLPGMGALAEAVRQEVVLEPTDSNIIFGLPHVRASSTPALFRSIVECHNDYLRFPLSYPIFDRINYVVWSMPAADNFAACDRAWANAADRAVPAAAGPYLQTPPGVEPALELARQVVGEAKTPCDQARRLKAYLLANYAYDLNTPADRADDPLADFLFNSKRGYCEHFATALAIMLRGLGVPARVATGFLEGEYNPIEDYYRVSERDAHAWVEMLLADGTWMTLDATPPITDEAEMNFLFQYLRELFDSVKYRWDSYVVGLNLDDQRHLANLIRDRGMIAGREFFSLPKRLGAILGLARKSPLALPALVAAAIAYWALTRGGAAGKQDRRTAASRVSREYISLLKLIAKKGAPKKPAETPLELARRLAALGFPAAEEFAAATSSYLALRFGEQGTEKNALQKIAAARAAAKAAKARSIDTGLGRLLKYHFSNGKDPDSR